MGKKNLFSGCGDVIKFTAQQNIKGNGFKKSTILVGAVIAVVFALISILMAVFQDDTSDVTGNDGEIVTDVDNASLELISKVLLVDNEALEDEVLNKVVSAAMTLEGVADKAMTVELVTAEEMADKLAADDSTVAVELKQNEDGYYVFDTYIKHEGALDEDIAGIYMDYVIVCVESYLYQMAGISVEDILCMESPYYTQSLAVNEEAESGAVMLTEMFVPMIFSFGMYAMVLMYGQTITKSVISEKASKLMEYLLTSIKPYALISGKVIALSGMAILQIAIWIVCGVGGYIVGAHIAESINPDYINYVNLVIDVMNGDGGVAFSGVAIVLAVISMCAGFVMFSVLAALIASAISKIEDMSSSQGVFQMFVIVGWLVAYFAPLLGNDTIMRVVNMIPITAPFIVPANILLGSCSIIEGVISLAIMFVTMFVLILFTGRVYKGKLFNRK